MNFEGWHEADKSKPCDLGVGRRARTLCHWEYTIASWNIRSAAPSQTPTGDGFVRLDAKESVVGAQDERPTLRGSTPTMGEWCGPLDETRQLATSD